jgi:hypothetical protein
MRFVSRLGAALALLSLATLSTPAASEAKDPIVNSVAINNESHNCAWVTVYGADSWTKWLILPNSRPRFVPATQTWVAHVSTGARAYTEVKVMAEIVKGPGCTGPRIADVEDYRKESSPGGGQPHYIATIWKGPTGGFHIGLKP